LRAILSLIADSLKKASKEKLASLSFKPRVPLMRGGKLGGNPPSRWLRVLLLMVVPGSILALMLYLGLGAKKEELTAKRPLPEEASATREKVPPIVPAVGPPPVEEKKKFPGA
jgi:hypothetical protein